MSLAKVTSVTARDPAAVNGDGGCTVGSECRLRSLRSASGEADDVADEAETVGADEVLAGQTIRGVVAILIQRAGGEECEE